MDNDERYTAEELAHNLAEIFLEGAECACGGTGVFDGEWVFRRESSCTCEVGSDDFETKFHAVDCDTVPCPFCQLLVV